MISQAPLTEVSVLGAGWSKADVDGWLHVDDSLRTNHQGTADLDLIGRGQVTVGPNSLVRFTALDTASKARPEMSLALEEGTLEAAVAGETEGLLLSIDSPAGRLRLSKGSRARLTVAEDDTVRLNLVVGQAELEQAGQTRQISQGASLVIGPGSLVSGEPDGGSRGDGGAPVTPDPAAADAGPPEVDAGDLSQAEGVMLRPTKGARIEARGPDDDDFTALGSGRTRVAPGTVVRVSGGNVEVNGPDGSQVIIHDGGEALILGSQGGRLRVVLRGGRGSARSNGSGVASLSVPGGRVDTVSMGSQSALRATVINGRSTRVNVTSGVGEVTTDGRSERVETGGEIVLSEGRSPSITAMRKILPMIEGRGVIHDPSPSGGFSVRFDSIDGCKTYSVAIRHGGKAMGEAIVSQPWISFSEAAYGSYAYRATCHEPETPSEVREGQVTRVADRSGSARLPTTAPRNTLETNGRRYSVTYQNRLPAITLRWSKAPEASGYQLSVFNEGGGGRVHSGQHKRAAHSFRSGFFREGSYFWFFRAQSGETSPVTKMRIAFDNVSPSIQIIEPRNGAAASGSVRVRGVAAFGSTVSVNGVALELGQDFRFDQQVPVRSGGLLVFRVSSPGRGTGLYLRHLGSE